MTSDASDSLFWRWLRTVGPAIIVASVVLGPGSILTNARVGWQYGYDLVWVLVTACVLMIGLVLLSGQLGVILVRTPCEEIAHRLGRPMALLAGGSLFLVATCFQFSNNLGVLFAVEPFLAELAPGTAQTLSIFALVALNALAIAALFGLRHLYRPVEWLMKGLVGLMVIGFAANLLFAQPSLLATLGGLVPRIDTLPAALDPQVIALFATTFSVAGAFYQAYLVRQKGWTTTDVRKGLVDTLVGIATLGLCSLMVMITAASVLRGNPDVTALDNAADVARQLAPLFGPMALVLFCAGIFAGALSSFLVNAMIGGTVLSDGLGYGGSIDQLGPRLGTLAALLFGMIVAIAIKVANLEVGPLIILAQGVTVLGNPLLAGLLLWLATRSEVLAQLTGRSVVLTLGGVGFLAVSVLSVHRASELLKPLFNG